MKRSVISLTLVPALTAIAIPAFAAPLRAQVGRCKPEALIAGANIGNSPVLRAVDVHFGYVSDAATPEAKQKAVDDTERVEICSGRFAESVQCPWSDQQDDAWVVFDRATGKGTEPNPDKVQPIDQSSVAETPFRVPVDWHNPLNPLETEGLFLFVRVNQATTFESISDGFCPVVYLLAGQPDDRFRVYGVEFTVPNPFFPFNACEDGNRAAPGLLSSNACTDTAMAEFVLDKYNRIHDDWQLPFLLNNVDLIPPAWQASSGGDCDVPGGGCPLRVFIHTHFGGSEANPGVVRLALTGAMLTNPLQAVAADALQAMGHEYFHSFQVAWRKAGCELQMDGKLGCPQISQQPFHEGGAEAIEAHMCLDNYDPSLPSCAAAGRIADFRHPSVRVNDYLNNPSANMMQIPYVGALFWRYAMEQYAIPPNLLQPAHPTGSDSVISSNSSDLGHESRRPDEGVDLMRHMVEEFALDNNQPIFDAMDAVLRKELGRGLEPMVLDLHTAMVLKDYPHNDLQWQFEWVGDFNAGATSTSYLDNPPDPVLVKPFTVKCDVVGAGLDYMRRTRRALDIYTPFCPSGPFDRFLFDGEVEASTQPTGISAFGTAILSVAPVATYGPLQVQLTPLPGKPLRFRIFTVDPTGVPTLLTSCNQKPSGDPQDTVSCPLMDVFDPNNNTIVSRVNQSIPIPIDGSIREVIVVASAGRQPGAFTWSFGFVQPRVVIIDPLSVRWAEIGFPNTPIGKRPFLAQFTVLDELNQPMGVDVTQIVLRAPFCFSTVNPTCTLDRDTGDNDTGDYTLTGFANGVFWAVVTLPDDFYPTTPVIDYFDLDPDLARRNLSFSGSK